MRSVEYFNKVFGRKAEYTTPISDTNRVMLENSAKLDKDRLTRHFDGNFCSCSSCRGFQSQKEISAHRHAQEVENSQRNRGEPPHPHIGYLRSI